MKNIQASVMFSDGPGKVHIDLQPLQQGFVFYCGNGIDMKLFQIAQSTESMVTFRNQQVINNPQAINIAQQLQLLMRKCMPDSYFIDLLRRNSIF